MNQVQQITYNALLWIWLNPTSAAAMTGGTIAGGQAHIAFGRSGSQVQAFFQDSLVGKNGREWSFTLEPYANIPQHTLRLVENSPHARRAGECRIPSQSPRSREAYPLWKHAVVPIPRNSRPRQLLLLLRDIDARFHIRLLDVHDLHRLPDDAAKSLLSGRDGNSGHVLVARGDFREVAPTAPTEKEVLDEAVIEVIRGSVRTKTQPDNEMWDRFAAYVRQVKQEPRRRGLLLLRRLLRDSRVRDIALQCFGKQCQVRGCTFTVSLRDELLPLVLEVHHLKSVGRGGSDSLFNLAVLCANHHRLFEGLPVKLVQSDNTDDVIVKTDDDSFLIERDLESLRRRLEQ
jgi:hypothetical protein